MKKLSAAAAAVMLVFSMTMTAFASNANDVPDDKNIDVQAVYVSEFDDVDIGSIGDNDPLPLPDGRKIKIDSDNENDVGLRYVVTIITKDQPEAYDYVSGAVSETGSDFYAVHIGFYKGDEKVEPSGNVTVTMTSPDGYDSAEFVYIAADGQLSEIERETVDGNIVFSTDKGGYFVLVNADESSLPDSSSDESESSSQGGSGSGDDPSSGSTDDSSLPETSSGSSDSSDKTDDSSAASGSSGSSDNNTSNPNTGVAVGTGVVLVGGLVFAFVKNKRNKDE